VRIRSHRYVTRAAVVAVAALACGLIPGGGALAASSPTTSIDSGPADGSFVASGASATFTFSASESTGDTFTFQCQFDGHAPVACDSGSFDTGDLADGPHTFTVTATDENSVPDPSPPSRKWTVDTTNPTVNITSPAANGTFVASASPSFAFSATDANLDTVQCSVDGGSFSACMSPFSPTLSDESHTVQVKATDKAGNTASASRSLTVDTTPPVVNITSGPAANEFSSEGSPSFGFAATDTNLDTVQCKLDGGNFGPCTSASSYAPGSLSDGSHTIVIQATDKAGNQASDSRTWSVDTTPPVTTDNSPLKSQTASPPVASKRNQAFTLSPDPGAGSPIASTSYSVDGHPAQSGTFVSLPTPADGANDGWHTITYHSVDSAQPTGNVEATKTTYEYVDTTAPNTVILTASVGATASFSFGAVASSDPDDTTGPYTFECLLIGSGATVFTPCPPMPYTGLQAGTYTFEVRALDGAGNADPTPATETWTSTPGAASTTLVMPGTVTTDPGTGATSDLQNVDSVYVPTVSGSSGALVANALASASGQGTDVGASLDTPIAGVDCPSNWKCFDPKTIVFSVQQLGAVVGTPVYKFTLDVDTSLRPAKLTLSGVKIFHDGVNVPNCNKPHPKTPAPGPICISERTQFPKTDTLRPNDWEFVLITTINGRVRM
jgi:large repetitive protein